MVRTQQNRSNNNTPTPPSLSRHPQRAMQEMMQIIDALKSVMDAETAALRETNTGKFIALQEDKLQAARNYQEGVSQMIARKEEMKTVPEGMKRILEQKRAEFSVTAENNMEALGRMRKGMERLSNRIMQTAKKEAEDSRKFAYGAHGKLEGSGKATLGVNERA